MVSATTDLHPHALEVVRRLLHVNYDSAREFEIASLRVSDPLLSDYLQRCSDERNGFAAELASLIEANGERPSNAGTARGLIHRWWLEMRSVIQQGNDRAILSEVERGEDIVERAYRSTVDLDEPLAPPLREVLAREYSAVRSVHDRIRMMRDATPEAKD